MRTRSIAIAAGIVALGATLVTPLSASAATVTVTGTVTGPNGPVAVDVQWYAPDAEYDEDGSGDYYGGVLSKASDGSFSLTIPSTVRDYYIVANLDESTVSEDTGLAQRTDDSVVSEFYGTGDAHDEISSLVEPYATPTSTSLDIQLAGTGEIEGTAARLKGAEVYLVPSTVTDASEYIFGFGSSIAETTADADGHFLFDQLVPGHFRVVAVSRGNGGAGVVPWLSPVVEVQSQQTAELAVDAQQGAAVSGTITAAGRAAADSVVYATKAGAFLGYAIADSLGRYRINGLPGGTPLSISVSDYYSGVYAFGPGTGILAHRVTTTLATGHTTTVPVSTTPGGEIAGIVDTKHDVTSYTGDVHVTIRSTSGASYEYYAGATRPNGYRVRSLPAGRYTVYATDADGKHFGSTSVVVKAGVRTVVPALRMTRPTVTLTGTVPGATGGSVQVTHAGGYAFSRIDRTGHYTVSHVVPGVVTAYASATGHATRGTRFSVTRSGAHTLAEGAELGVVIARLSLPQHYSGGAEVALTGAGSDSSYYDYFSTSNHVHIDAAPGTYTLGVEGTSLYGDQEGSPFALTSPSKPVTVRSGVVTNAGNLTVTVVR